jgi:hypothetical protein
MNRHTNRFSRPTLEALERLDVPSYLAAEFPGQGVWLYNSAGGSWQQMTAANASQVAADSAGDVVAEIPGQGVWLYGPTDQYANRAWQQITANNASGLAMALRYEPTLHSGTFNNVYVVAEFPGQGLWLYDNFTLSNPPGGYSSHTENWQQLTANNAATEAVATNGQVVAEFPGQGVWIYSNITGGGSQWQQLTPSDASSLAVSGGLYGPATVVAEFPGYGVWRIQEMGGWVQLTAANAATVGINDSGDVVGTFTGSGVWTYSDTGAGGYNPGWNCLTAADAALVSIDASGNVHGQFGVDGIWYDHFGYWICTTANNASSLGVGG